MPIEEGSTQEAAGVTSPHQACVGISLMMRTPSLEWFSSSGLHPDSSFLSLGRRWLVELFSQPASCCLYFLSPLDACGPSEQCFCQTSLLLFVGFLNKSYPKVFARQALLQIRLHLKLRDCGLNSVRSQTVEWRGSVSHAHKILREHLIQQFSEAAP